MLREIVDDLLLLQHALRAEPMTERTADAISTIAGAAQAALHSGRRIVGEIPVPLPRKQGIHPPQANMLEADMKFVFFSPSQNVLVEGVVSEVQVCVRALMDVGGTVVELEDHWRIDTQPQQKGIPREAHPLFHFQRGGHAQDNFAVGAGFVPGPIVQGLGSELRGLMQYAGPRIPVMPMCPTAAFDFVLAHHDGPLWRRLMSDPDYAAVVTRCQERLWNLYEAGLLDLARRKVLLGHY